MPEDLVLLHGFAGTHRMWDGVLGELAGERYRPLAIDLPSASADAAVQAVLAAVDGEFALCGYSLGGRIALRAALAAPERVSRLILVSATAGINDPRERAERLIADNELAARIENWTIEEFADYWQSLPIFAGTSAAARAAWGSDLLRGDPVSLAAMLRTTGSGVMAPVWDRLAELRMPATVVAGSNDAKYVAIGEQLASLLPGATLEVVEGAGHGIPREAPAALAALIERS